MGCIRILLKPFLKYGFVARLSIQVMRFSWSPHTHYPGQFLRLKIFHLTILCYVMISVTSFFFPLSERSPHDVQLL